MSIESRSQTSIQLTQTVQKSGCATKIEAEELKKILGSVRFPEKHPNLIVDSDTFDDAAIYKVSDEISLVQTLDFFTPMVDSPYFFGQVAAANSLSDVYAMGGLPKTAMGILAYPLATLDSQVIIELMQGASDKIAESKACFVGGHSIDDDTLKFGLSVTGFIEKDRSWRNSGAKPGDILVLTKPLGTGTISTALKRQKVSEPEITDVIASMTQLNEISSLISRDEFTSIHAATDITGFGLVGHSLQMAKSSKVSFRFSMNEIPRFSLTETFLEAGYLTKAHRSNFRYVEKHTHFKNIMEIEKMIVCDPQTSGGLLLSIHPSMASQIIEKIKMKFPKTSVIGSVEPPHKECFIEIHG